MCGGLRSPSSLCSSQSVAQRLILLRCNLDLESPATPKSWAVLHRASALAPCTLPLRDAASGTCRWPLAVDATSHHCVPILGLAVGPSRVVAVRPCRSPLREEFGCGVASRHVRRCCRNRGGLLRKQKLDGNAMHLPTQTTGPKGMWSYTAQWPCVVVVVIGKPTRDRE